MIELLFSLRLSTVARQTANCLLRALALVLAIGPPGRPGAPFGGAATLATTARRACYSRNNTWRQLSTLDDATLRDIGMTRPALGQYLVDLAPARQASGQPSTTRGRVLSLPARVGT